MTQVCRRMVQEEMCTMRNGLCVIYFAVVYRGKRAGATAAMRRGQQEKPAVDSGTA